MRLATLTFVISATLLAAAAQAQDTANCAAIENAEQRLACYDAATNGGKDNAAPAPPAQAWSVNETKSPMDDSPIVRAYLGDESGQNVLSVRCVENRTELAVGTKEFLGVSDRVRVTYRIGKAKPVSAVWAPSTGYQAAFATNPIQLLRQLPDNADLFIRVAKYNGGNVDAQFNTGLLSEVVAKVSAACKWPSAKPS